MLARPFLAVWTEKLKAIPLSLDFWFTLAELHFRIEEPSHVPRDWMSVSGPSRTDGSPLVLELQFTDMYENTATFSVLRYMVYFRTVR
jgi:hypothetical protein